MKEEKRYKFLNDEKEFITDTKYKEIIDSENDKDTLLAVLNEQDKDIRHWHELYLQRNNQFQSVRQRYHLLNRLQADYNKKDKLHLSEMHCLELTELNEQLTKELRKLKEETCEPPKMSKSDTRTLQDLIDKADRVDELEKSLRLAIDTICGQDGEIVSIVNNGAVLNLSKKEAFDYFVDRGKLECEYIKGLKKE